MECVRLVAALLGHRLVDVIILPKKTLNFLRVPVSVKSSHPSKERVTIAERRRRSPVYSPLCSHGVANCG